LLTLVMSLASNLSREVYKTSILTPETGPPTPILGIGRRGDSMSWRQTF
jgi:hypothetical protein